MLSLSLIVALSVSTSIAKNEPIDPHPLTHYNYVSFVPVSQYDIAGADYAGYVEGIDGVEGLRNAMYNDTSHQITIMGSDENLSSDTDVVFTMWRSSSGPDENKRYIEILTIEGELWWEFDYWNWQYTCTFHFHPDNMHVEAPVEVPDP